MHLNSVEEFVLVFPEGGVSIRGVCQMSILLHKPYLVKWPTKGGGDWGGGGQKCPKNCLHDFFLLLTIHVVFASAKFL